MSSWIGKIFGIGYKAASKKLPPQTVKSQAMQKVATKVESIFEPAAAQPVRRSYWDTMKAQIDYGKTYFKVVPGAKPEVKVTPSGSTRIYPCEDGEKLMVSYVKRADGSSSLAVCKSEKTEYKYKCGYKSFFSNTIVKPMIDRFGDKETKIIKKKYGYEHTLGCRPGEDVHRPLKLWDRFLRGLNRKKTDYQVLSSNPNDFDRFVL